MIGIGEASAAISGIKTAMDILRGAQSLKSETEINSAMIDVQRVLLDAQASALQDKERQMALLSRIQELESKLTELQKRSVDRERYQLTQFPSGDFAYVLKEEGANGEPEHRLCANCFDEDVKSILQGKRKQSGGESVFFQRCQSTVIVHPFPAPQVIKRKSSWME